MTTKTFTITDTAGANRRLAIFRLADGYVLDFSDHTFKALGLPPTTPYVAGTELTALGGSTASVYKAAVDLANVNSTSTPADFIVDWFSDTGLANRVSQSVQITVVSSDLAGANVSFDISDPIPELTGIPSATPSLTEAVMFLFMELRNRFKVTRSKRQIHNAAGTVICEQAIGVDSESFTRQNFSNP